MRYFYRDPLEAAYMAKHFGIKTEADVRIINVQPGKSEMVTHHMVFDSPEMVLLYQYCNSFHIHSYSLHLLEPQDGDAVEFDRWHWDRQRHDELKDAQPEPHYAIVRIDTKWKRIISAGIGWDMVKLHEPFSLPFRIICRGSKAFHWPQCEAE